MKFNTGFFRLIKTKLHMSNKSLSLSSADPNEEHIEVSFVDVDRMLEAHYSQAIKSNLTFISRNEKNNREYLQYFMDKAKRKYNEQKNTVDYKVMQTTAEIIKCLEINLQTMDLSYKSQGSLLRISSYLFDLNEILDGRHCIIDDVLERMVSVSECSNRFHSRIDILNIRMEKVRQIPNKIITNNEYSQLSRFKATLLKLLTFININDNDILKLDIIILKLQNFHTYNDVAEYENISEIKKLICTFIIIYLNRTLEVSLLQTIYDYSDGIQLADHVFEQNDHDIYVSINRLHILIRHAILIFRENGERGCKLSLVNYFFEKLYKFNEELQNKSLSGKDIELRMTSYTNMLLGKSLRNIVNDIMVEFIDPDILRSYISSFARNKEIRAALEICENAEVKLKGEILFKYFPMCFRIYDYYTTTKLKTIFALIIQFENLFDNLNEADFEQFISHLELNFPEIYWLYIANLVSMKHNATYFNYKLETNLAFLKEVNSFVLQSTNMLLVQSDSQTISWLNVSDFAKDVESIIRTISSKRSLGYKDGAVYEFTILFLAKVGSRCKSLVPSDQIIQLYHLVFLALKSNRDCNGQSYSLNTKKLYVKLSSIYLLLHASINQGNVFPIQKINHIDNMMETLNGEITEIGNEKIPYICSLYAEILAALSNHFDRNEGKIIVLFHGIIDGYKFIADIPKIFRKLDHMESELSKYYQNDIIKNKSNNHRNRKIDEIFQMIMKMNDEEEALVDMNSTVRREHTKTITKYFELDSAPKYEYVRSLTTREQNRYSINSVSNKSMECTCNSNRSTEMSSNYCYKCESMLPI